MTNLCSRVPATGATSSSVAGARPKDVANANLNYTGVVYSNGGVVIGNDYLLQIPVNGAFDAETFGITCQAFSNAAVSIVSLQTGLSNMQAQMSALLSGQTTQALDPERLQAEGALFGVVLAAACLIWGLKKVLGVFRPDDLKD